MAFSLHHLRLWISTLALILAAVVGGFYLRARWELRRAERELPKKVGINIQQTSEGFTFSKSEGGRTLFTIHASKATKFKVGGRAELHDVSITVYGTQSDRYDRISGSDFVYDPHAGTVVSRGVVEIDLAGGGGQAPAAAPPGEPSSEASQLERLRIGKLVVPPVPKEPIQVRLEGLSFNQKTGIAKSDGRVEFRVAQVAGTARGLVYDSHKHELELRSTVDVRTAGSQVARLEARSGTITKEPRQLTLRSVELTKEGRSLASDQAVVHLAEDNSIQRVDAAGNVRFRGGDGIELRAAKGELTMAAENRAESAWFGGGVDFESPQQEVSGHCGELRLRFAGRSQPASREAELIHAAPAKLETIYASRGVLLRQSPQAGKRAGQTMTMTSGAVTLAVRAGRELGSAETDGPGELTIEQAGGKRGQQQTRIEARQFKADFAARDRVRTVRARGGVVVTHQASGEPDKVSTSQSMLAEFNPPGELARVTQEGNFRYHEAQSSRQEPGGRSASAARASYALRDQSLTLSGSPRIVDGGMTVTADRVRLLRRGGELLATGSVKTTYSQLRAEPNGALLASADPVHVTARSMSARQSSGVAHYSGGARLWQGANIVEAQTIDFDQRGRSIVAEGDARNPVRSNFERVDARGKATTVLVTAPRLEYSDLARKASFSGGVRAQAADGVLTASRADVFLHPAGSRQSRAPSRLERIVASGGVLVRQQERRVQGERLEYVASSGTYVMSGGEPTLSDPVNGTLRAHSLTFYSHDDRVIAEGGDASRVVTHTHISR